MTTRGRSYHYTTCWWQTLRKCR